jgi:predicted nucleotidyltransferase
MPKKRKGKKSPKIHSDARGHYVWDNYFVGGKQKRSKRRVAVIDGEIIDDLDTWLLDNSDDCFLHQIERWDLIEQHRLEEEGPHTEESSMKPPPRKLRLNMLKLESAFEIVTSIDPSYADEPYVSFLNLSSGEVVAAEDDEEIDALFRDENHLDLPDHLFENWAYGGLEEFVYSLPEGPQRQQLERVISGKRAFRRLKEIVFGAGNVQLKHRWSWFETRQKRELIVEWLRDHQIEPEWDIDIFEAPPLPDKRPDLLRAVLDFVRDTRRLPGVSRIALLGSITTSKPIPKDVDILVEVEDEMSLQKLASLTRTLLGKTMQTGDGCGADVFLCDTDGEYLGRICSYKNCAPDIRKSCQAKYCGRREYLCDDFKNVQLDPSLVVEPPLSLWPEIVARTEVPEDVREILIAGL